MKNVDALFKTKPICTAYIRRVRKLFNTLQHGILGQGFALFLHYDMHLSLDKISRINGAAVDTCRTNEAPTRLGFV